jgi:hypothetical protein
MKAPARLPGGRRIGCLGSAMVTAELPFECINEGFALMSDPKTIRIVLRVAQEHV